MTYSPAHMADLLRTEAKEERGMVQQAAGPSLAGRALIDLDRQLQEARATIAALEQQRDTYLDQRVQAEAVIAALRAEAARPEPAGQDTRALAERLIQHNPLDPLVMGQITHMKAGPLILALARAYLAAEQRVEALTDVLSGLSVYVSTGIGDDTRTPEQWDERIRWGIDHLVNATAKRAEDAEQRATEARKSADGWLEVARDQQRLREAAESDRAALHAENADLRRQLAAQDAALTRIAVRQYQGGVA